MTSPVINQTIDFSSQQIEKLPQSIDKESLDFIQNWFQKKDYFYVKTSGSTGVPKEIKLSRKHMIISALKTAEFLELKKGDSCLICLPSHTIACKMMLVRAIVIGMKATIITSCRSPFTDSEKGYDFAALVPLQLQESIEKKEFTNTKKIIIGGAPIPDNLEEALSKSSNLIYHTFGMTETVSHIAMRRIGQKYFDTLPEVTVSIDQRSCLVVNSPMTENNPTITNDVVSVISPTSFQWIGRHDFTINSGGIKIQSETLEKMITNIISTKGGIQKVLIFGKPDQILGEKVCLVLENKVLTTEEIKKLKERLPKYHYPKDIYFSKKFTYNTSGKINRSKTIKDLLKS